MFAVPYLFYYGFIMLIALPVYKFSEKRIANLTTWESYIVIIFATLAFIGWGHVGYDYRNYLGMFEETPILTKYDWKNLFNKTESFFFLFMSLVKTIIPNYYCFRIINMFIDLILLTICFRQYCSISILPFCFLFFLLFGGLYWEIDFIRNGKAVIIYFVSLKYFHEKKFLRFTILNIIAYFFHVSAVILFISSFFLFLLTNRKMILMLFLMGMILAFFGIGFTQVIGSIARPFVSGKFLFMLDYYLSSSNFGASHGITIGYIEKIISFCIIFYYAPDLIAIDERLKVIINLFYIYILIVLFFSDVKIIIERIAALYKFPYWILFPIIYQNKAHKNKSIFLILLLLYGLIKVYDAHNYQIYEYYIIAPWKNSSL
jgi:hypothetical protein